MDTTQGFSRLDPKLEPVVINGDSQTKKQRKTVLGVQPKVAIAAVLLFLLIVVFIVTVVIVAIAHSETKTVDEGSVSAVTQAVVEVRDRVLCPFKSYKQCVRGGCIYSVKDPDGKAVPRGTPYCYYKPSSFSLSKASFKQQGNTLHSELNVDNTTTATFTIENSEDNSLVLEISKTAQSKRRRSRGVSKEASLYNVIFHDDNGFYVQRKAPSETLFNLKGPSSLHILEALIELTFTVPVGRLNGLGNYKVINKKFDGSTYTMWTRSEQQGAHPFYLLTTANNVTHGLYIDTTYPVDITLLQGNKVKLVTVASELKLRLLMGPTMAEVIKQYWNIIGAPGMPPFWGLGMFYGSQQTDSLKDLQNLMSNNSNLDPNIPSEGILLPGALNEYRQPFSYDIQTMAYLSKELKNKTKLISTVPPAITTTSTTYLHTNGIAKDVYIKKVNGSALTGMYDRKMASYPDFTSTNVLSWWKANISLLETGYGFHLHLNYPYSSINGSIGLCSPVMRGVSVERDVLNLGNLEHNTICASAVSKKGSQLQLHNQFSYYQASVTHSTRLPWSVSERPLIVSDATSPGIGKYSGHFHHNVVNTHQGLRDVIGELVTYSYLGIPMTGPNLCGQGTPSTGLCKAWYYLSVISPLSWSMSDGVPHLFNADIAKAIKGALQFRQTLLHYHYNTLYNAHVHGTVPLRMMQFDYPGDDTAALYNNQVLLGPSLLYSPLLKEAETYRGTYLPTGVWCNWVDGACYEGPKIVTVKEANAPASFVFIKGGTTVLTQNTARTVEEMRKKKMRLIVVLDNKAECNGTQYIDDGMTSSSLTNEYYSLINYSVFNNTLTVSHPHHGYKGINVLYEKILVYGLTSKIKSLTSGTKSIKSSCILAGDSDYYKLIISDTNIEKNVNDDFSIQWTLQSDTNNGGG